MSYYFNALIRLPSGEFLKYRKISGRRGLIRLISYLDHHFPEWVVIFVYHNGSKEYLFSINKDQALSGNF